MTKHMTGTRKEWLAARLVLLKEEKELMRRSDELARQRQELPWVRIEKEYGFQTDEGSASLADLFRGRSQLLVYHFMFGYGARLTDERRGCTGCSLVADHFDGVIPHLNGRDITLVCESIAPLQELQDYKRHMGWRFPWVSSLGSDFKYDFGAAFTEEQRRNGADYNFRHVDEPEPQKEGMSVFALQEGAVHHTHSTYARGVEALMGAPTSFSISPRGAGMRTGSSFPRRGGAATTSTTIAEPRRGCRGPTANYRREDMNEAYTGGCACGAIRYEISDEPIFSNDCQCRDCQSKSGTGHGSYLTFPGKRSVKLEGEAKHWDIVGDSGKVKTRAFCPTCGSPVYMTYRATPDLFTIHAGSLDDPSRYKPQAVTYGMRGHAWDHIDPALPKFDKMPPG